MVKTEMFTKKQIIKIMTSNASFIRGPKKQVSNPYALDEPPLVFQTNRSFNDMIHDKPNEKVNRSVSLNRSGTRRDGPSALH